MADSYPTRRDDAAQDTFDWQAGNRQAGTHPGTQPDAPTAGGGFGLLANVAGAVVSVSLVIGVGVWGYKLLVRDVTGVPVVQATSGPMRVAPQDPGGDSARHQGLAVNDVAGIGAASAPADRLVLAPRPAQLSDEDMPAAILAALPRYDPLPAETPATQTAEAGAGDEALPDDAGEGAETTPQVASIRALADQIAQGAVALEPETTDTAAVATAEADAAEPEAVVIAASATAAPRTIKGGIARSLRPRKRPQVMPVAASAAAPAATVAAAVVAPEAVPVGTRLAQLGAFDSAEVAEKEWQRLNARFGDYLDGKSRVIQRASSGGRTFYRLRAMGFADIDDARRFCSALVAEKADCIPVVTR